MRLDSRVEAKSIAFEQVLSVPLHRQVRPNLGLAD